MITQVWGVAENYMVRKDLLIQVGLEVRGYDPMQEPSLPIELAALHEGKIAPARFASKYGLLGYDRLVPREKRLGGDPIQWIGAHARAVFFSLDLVARINSGDTADLLEGLCGMPKDFYGSLAECRLLDFTWIRGRGWLAHVIKSHSRERTGVTLHQICLSQVNTTVLTLINPNIASIRRELMTDHRGRVTSVFRFDAMIQCVYWQIADRLERGGIRRCKFCGRFFVPSGTKQRFCSPPSGVRRSRCAQNYHVRRFREKEGGR